MTAQIIDFNAALRARQAQCPVSDVAGVLLLNTDDSHGFYPEMGERANPTKPIYGSYCYKKWAIDWRKEDDQKVRDFCKKNRIKLDCVGWNEQESRTYAPFGKGVGSFHALVTDKSYNKMSDAGMTTTEILLD